MKNWNTQSTVETIGLFAVVLSLIFVGLELRQNSIATIAQTNSNVAESFIDINLAMATSEELARALTAYGDDPANLSAADVVQVLGLWRALFHIWSNAHTTSQRHTRPGNLCSHNRGNLPLCRTWRRCKKL